MVLLVLDERLLRKRPDRLNRFKTRRENGDITSLENRGACAIADVGDAWPSRSGRARC
jgi:hypothetical protein